MILPPAATLEQTKLWRRFEDGFTGRLARGMWKTGVSPAWYVLLKKGPPNKGKSPMQIFNAGAPFERLQMDIVGLFPFSVSGNRYLLVTVDCFTKWVKAFPLKNARASTITEVFVNQIVSKHVPLKLHTD